MPRCVLLMYPVHVYVCIPGGCACVDVGVHVKVCTEMNLYAFNPKCWVKWAEIKAPEFTCLYLYITDFTWCCAMGKIVGTCGSVWVCACASVVACQAVRLCM